MAASAIKRPVIDLGAILMSPADAVRQFKVPAKELRTAHDRGELQGLRDRADRVWFRRRDVLAWIAARGR